MELKAGRIAFEYFFVIASQSLSIVTYESYIKITNRETVFDP